MHRHNLFSIQPQDNIEAAITRDFGIPKQTIDQFKADAFAAFPNVNLDFIFIYKSLSTLRQRYGDRNRADDFEEVMIHPEHHATLLAYCTCNGELVRRFAREYELTLYSDAILFLDSPSLFTHLARPWRPWGGAGKLIYNPIGDKKFIDKADARNWLEHYQAYRLTDFFIEPGNEFCANLSLSHAETILDHGSLQNVQKVMRIMGIERLLMLGESFFDYLTRNQRISAQFIYDLMLQLQNQETPFVLSGNWFLRNLLNTGKRDKAVCQQIIQLILDNNIQLKGEIDKYTIDDWIGTGLDAELILLMQRGLLTLPHELAYLRESQGELKLKEKPHVETDAVTTFVNHDADLSRVHKARR